MHHKNYLIDKTIISYFFAALEAGVAPTPPPVLVAPETGSKTTVLVLPWDATTIADVPNRF
ncbi:hypothetical protein CPB83DRAFT_841606 [Crepidotus variabilis]|uniref:Uncharacterized protein n=1 Tax=Crepidotus variabilis TaxID=179855 RepID=A0A9P6ESJ4_9AGAR|nr:hypothetical protein CPB83DRAFT_841606 [Crepidotus variabilis]